MHEKLITSGSNRSLRSLGQPKRCAYLAALVPGVRRTKQLIMVDIVSWIKLPRHLAWPLVIVSGLLLWGSNDFKSGLGLQPFIDNHREWIGIVFLFFLVLGLQQIGAIIYEKIKSRASQRKAIEERKARDQAFLQQNESNINNLTNDEKEILAYFLNNNTRTQDLNYQNGNVTHLTSLGFIYRASNVSYGGLRGSFTFPYNISDWAWDYIQKKPEVVN